MVSGVSGVHMDLLYGYPMTILKYRKQENYEENIFPRAFFYLKILQNFHLFFSLLDML